MRNHTAPLKTHSHQNLEPKARIISTSEYQGTREREQNEWALQAQRDAMIIKIQNTEASAGPVRGPVLWEINRGENLHIQAFRSFRSFLCGEMVLNNELSKQVKPNMMCIKEMQGCLVAFESNNQVCNCRGS